MYSYSGLTSASTEQVDRATLTGIVCSFGLVLLVISLGGSLPIFFDLNSFLIVAGGTLGATLISFPLQDVMRAFAVLRTAFFPSESAPEARLRRILKLSEKARLSGMLSLQEEIAKEPDPFLRKCTELVIDGVDAADIRRILDLEMTFLADRHRRGAFLFQSMGAIAPGMGLIGTLIGLVQMLNNLNDPDAIGPAMAVALITTFYGSVLANFIFNPIAGKLRTRSEEEALVKEMSIEGLICIARGISPQIIEECLMSFLPPERRSSRYR